MQRPIGAEKATWHYIFSLNDGGDQSSASCRTLGGRVTPAARRARLAAGRGAESRRKRLPSCSREQGLLYNGFEAARCEGRGVLLLILSQFLAEPSHRSIKVMQIEPLDALDPIVVPPAVRRAIGAARKQAMQNGEKHGTLQREILMARAGEVLDDFPAACLPSQSFERQRRADASRRTRRRLAGGERVTDRRLWLWRRSGRPSAAGAAFAQILDASKRCDDLRAHRVAPVSV